MRVGAVVLGGDADVSMLGQELVRGGAFQTVLKFRFGSIWIVREYPVSIRSLWVFITVLILYFLHFTGA